MAMVTLSLWLPVSRANFFSFAARNWLVRSESDPSRAWSGKLDEPGYVPRLQAPVLRRLLEVMPRSFGYQREGRCSFRGDAGQRQRPSSVELTLDLSGGAHGSWGASQRRANADLVRAGAESVTLAVDENGNYMFTATVGESGTGAEVRAALGTHVWEVFGGDYVVHPLSAGENRRINEGELALKRYNGLIDLAGQDLAAGQPLGILNFFQLNTLAEGLWNDMLLPAVYLEQDDYMTQHIAGTENAGVLRTIGDVVLALATDADVAQPKGQFVVLYHFLAITAHGSLQRLKSSLESVRRHLLDEMMSALHRQSRLVQLNFGADDRERTPELAVGATESQLRGYAALVAAKLPLITNVREVLKLAFKHLRWVVTGPDARERSDEENSALDIELWRLDGQLDHWTKLLEDLTENVRSLSTSIEHAWMERLLYEQQQARSEQEAMAEVERSRQGVPRAERATRSAYNMMMMVLAVVAVVVAVVATDIQQLGRPGTGWWHILQVLWPILALGTFAYFVVPLFDLFRRARKEKRGVLTSYPYEFAFRLDEPVHPEKMDRWLRDDRRRMLSAPGLTRLSVTNRGYGRVERVSVDTSLVKIHSTAAFGVAPLRYARFEVINEIFVHRIANRTQHVLVQCRLFGESPRPLRTEEVIALLRAVLGDIGSRLAMDDEHKLGGIVDESL